MKNLLLLIAISFSLTASAQTYIEVTINKDTVMYEYKPGTPATFTPATFTPAVFDPGTAGSMVRTVKPYKAPVPAPDTVPVPPPPPPPPPGYTLTYSTGYDVASDIFNSSNQAGNGSLSTTVFKTGPGSFKSVPANVSSGIRSEVQYSSSMTSSEGAIEYDVMYETLFLDNGHSFQFHPTTSGGSASPGLWHVNGKFDLVNWKGGTNIHHNTGITILTNHWYHVRFEYKFGSSGYWRTYIDGVLIPGGSWTGQVGDGSGQYLKIGVNMWQNQSSVAYYDNLRIYKKDPVATGFLQFDEGGSEGSKTLLQSFYLPSQLETTNGKTLTIATRQIVDTLITAKTSGKKDAPDTCFIQLFHSSLIGIYNRIPIDTINRKWDPRARLSQDSLSTSKTTGHGQWITGKGTLDLQREASRPRMRRMTGNYITSWKSRQVAINSSTPEVGHYSQLVIGFESYGRPKKQSGKQSFKSFQWNNVDSSAPNAAKLKVESKAKNDSADILVISRRDLEVFIAQQIGRQALDQQGRVVGWEKGDLMKSVSKNVTNDEYEKIYQVVDELVRRLADVYAKSLQRLKK